MIYFEQEMAQRRAKPMFELMLIVVSFFSGTGHPRVACPESAVPGVCAGSEPFPGGQRRPPNPRRGKNPCPPTVCVPE